MEPLFTYSRRGFSLTVYPNRVDITQGAFLAKQESILMRNISEVVVTRLQRLRISTNDGKTHEYLVGGDAEKARAAILSAIA